MSSQSGALGLAILDYVRALNIGISTFISVGNKADVSSNDLIQYWAHDPRTSVILLYVESFGNPRKFGQIAAKELRAIGIQCLLGPMADLITEPRWNRINGTFGEDGTIQGLFELANIPYVGAVMLPGVYDIPAANQPAISREMRDCLKALARTHSREQLLLLIHKLAAIEESLTSLVPISIRRPDNPVSR